MLNFVLLPGWGFRSDALRRLGDALERYFPKARVLLSPGFPYEYCSSIHHRCELQAWRDDTFFIHPDMEVCYVGWSLGGAVASALASLPDAQTAGLVTLGTNVRFVADEAWPQAMPYEEFGGFRRAWQRRPQETLNHFARLCLQGAPDVRAYWQLMMATVDSNLSQAQGSNGLKWLAETHLEEHWMHNQYFHFHLFAAEDALVPVNAAAALSNRLSPGHVAVIKEAGHMFPLTHAEAVAARMVTMFDTWARSHS